MKEVKINVPEGYEIDKDKSTFENIVFKKKNELPKSWEDLESVSGCWISGDCDLIEINNLTTPATKNIFKTSEQAKASIALAQLSQLRDVYRQGWLPDWNDATEHKWIICFKGEKDIHICREWLNNEFLSFEEEETAELFLKNFIDLIEQAKPLMS